jgi:outer membrane protein assembly factor BamB
LFHPKISGEFSMKQFRILALAALSAILSFSVHSNIRAADPTTKKSAAEVAEEQEERTPQLHWMSAPRGRNALLWRVENDQLGSFTVAGDKVLVGGRLDKGNQGVLMCLSAETGQTRWRITHDKLPLRRNDMVGCITSTPFVDGDRVYYVSNRGELCCVGLSDGHSVWSIDMPKDLGIFKRDPGDIAQQAPSPIVVDDMVYCVTGHGPDYDFAAEKNIVTRPDAPSFIAVDKRTGKLIWSSNAPGKNIAVGQWSTPTWFSLDGASQVLFPGGDGLLYSFEPKTGKLLWKLDCSDPRPEENPREFITAPPLVNGDMAIVSPGYNIDMSGGSHRLVGIDLRTHAIRWTFTVPRFKFGGTFGPMAAANGIVYTAGGDVVVALDIKTGKPVWVTDLEASVWCGLSLVDGKLFTHDEDGNLTILSASDGKKLQRCELLGACRQATSVVRNGKVFALTRQFMLALRLPDEAKGH